MTLTLHNTIGNKQTAAHNGAWLDVVNPDTGKPFARCPESDQNDI